MADMTDERDAAMTGMRSYTIATSPEGTVGNAAGRAVARLLTGGGTFRVEVRPTAGQSALLPMIESGAVEMGIANPMEIAEAMKGEGVFGGRRLVGIRGLSVLFPQRTGMFVRADSGIRRIADLKGRRVGYGFPAMTSLARLVLATLANGGLSLADVVTVPVENANGAIAGLLDGSLDAAYAAPGAGRIGEADAALGGVHMLPLEMEAEAIAAMRRVVPYAFGYETEPQPGLFGIGETVHALSYDLPLLVGAQVDASIVHDIVETLAGNGDALAEALSDFRAFTPRKMARPLPCDYHPGAVRSYRERGVWPPA